jgi:hypothetical protein
MGIPFTNDDDALTMVNKKMPQSVIVAAIKSSPGEYDTSTNELIRLNAAGVTVGELATQNRSNHDGILWKVWSNIGPGDGILRQLRSCDKFASASRCCCEHRERGMGVSELGSAAARGSSIRAGMVAGCEPASTECGMEPGASAPDPFGWAGLQCDASQRARFNLDTCNGCASCGSGGSGGSG